MRERRDSGRFAVKMNKAGHAFLGQRWDSKGRSLGLWHGHRLLKTSELSAGDGDQYRWRLGSYACPPPVGVAWLHGAITGRARATLELVLAAEEDEKEDDEEDEQQQQQEQGREGKAAAKITAAAEQRRKKRLAAVVADCELALSVWPRAPEPLALLAACREQLRDLTGAIEAYEELLFLEPPAPRNVEDVEGIEALRERSLEVGC
jgi:tetratricopeptide (TPR) repeat protein